MLANESVILIDPSRKTSVRDMLSEVWSYRELLYFLVWKELKIRYKQTAVGAAWAVLQPLIAMLIFWLSFGLVLKVDTGGIPYPIFAYSGLVIWTYFSVALNQASVSLIANQSLLTKVYFPRALLPLAASLTGLVDYLIASVMMIVLMLIFGIAPTLWLPLVFIPLALAFMLASGLGFWLSSVSAKYRDVRIIVPFFVQLLLFVTPIIYPPSYLTGTLSFINTLNPLAAIINSQRGFVLGTGVADWLPLAYATVVSVLFFIGGMIYFSRYERKIADVV